MDNDVIVPAPQSPRMDNGVLKWFYGDTFAVDMVINLVEQEAQKDGTFVDKPINFDESDQIVVTFFNERKEVVYSFISKNISNDEKSEYYHTITLNFTKDVSHRFRRGKYTYCMKYVHKEDGNTVYTDITTICVNNRAEVEICH